MAGPRDDRNLAEAILRGEAEAFRCFGERFAPALEGGRAEAAGRWPEAGFVKREVFLRRAAKSAAQRYLEGCGEAEGPSPRSWTLGAVVARLHLADLHLACGLEAGSEAAWRAFARAFRRDLQDTIRGLVKAPALRAEVLEGFYGELFCGGRNGRALLATYRGTGPLGGWLRAVAFRRALTAARRRERAPHPFPPAGIGEAAPPWPEPDLPETDLNGAFLSRLSRTLRDAFAALPVRDRALLLLRYGRGMAQKRIARMEGMTEARLSRHLARVRRRLLQEITRALGLSPRGLEEILPEIRRSIPALAGTWNMENGTARCPALGKGWADEPEARAEGAPE